MSSATEVSVSSSIIESSNREPCSDKSITKRDSIITYTCSQIMKLNHGQTTKNPKVLQLFNSYPVPKQKILYGNKYNKNLYTESKKETDFDKKVLEFFRKELSTVTKSNYLFVTERLNNALIPEAELQNIGLIFYQNLIDCEFVVDELLKCLLLLRLSQQNTNANCEKPSTESSSRQVQETVIKHLLNEFNTPSKFTDTSSETGIDKMNRVRLSNTKVLAKLMLLLLEKDRPIDYLNHLLQDISLHKLLCRVIESINVTNQFNIKVLAITFGLVADILKEQSIDDYNYVVNKIKEISVNKQYNLSYRLLLK